MTQQRIPNSVEVLCDGCFWVTFGQSPSLKCIAIEAFRSCGLEIKIPESAEELVVDVFQDVAIFQGRYSARARY